jgi:hypothetical protein
MITHDNAELVPHSGRNAALRVGGPIVLFATFWFNWRTPLLRFDSALANELIFVAAMLLPTLALIAGPGGVSRRSRWLLRLLLVPFVLEGLRMSLGVAMWMPDTLRLGTDPTFERMVRYPWGADQLTLYRANCGMPFCENDMMVIRAERRALPGLLIVRDVCSNGPADSADVRLLTDDRLELRLLTREGKLATSLPPKTCAIPKLYSLR